jgi:hypothetical protein
MVEAPFDGGALDGGDEFWLFEAFRNGEGRRIGVPRVAATMFEAIALSKEILTLIVLSALLLPSPIGPP